LGVQSDCDRAREINAALVKKLDVLQKKNTFTSVRQTKPTLDIHSARWILDR